MKFLGVVFLAIFALTLTRACGAAEEYAPMTASVVGMKGTVHITKTGATTPYQAKVGDALAKGDKVETKGDGDVSIKTENGNVVTLGPNSQIIISELSLNKTTGDYRTVMDSKFGKLQARVEAKIKDHAKSTFEIRTPTAVCGVRGTVFYVVVGDTGVTQVFVASGSVNFGDPAGQNTFVVVENAAAAADLAGTVTELTGAEKDAIVAEYNAFLAAGGGEEGGPDAPPAPSQQNDPQSLTEVTPLPVQELEPQKPPSPSSGSSEESTEYSVGI